VLDLRTDRGAESTLDGVIRLTGACRGQAEKDNEESQNPAITAEPPNQ
jgi:hypothetical protein